MVKGKSAQPELSKRIENPDKQTKKKKKKKRKMSDSLDSNEQAENA